MPSTEQSRTIFEHSDIFDSRDMVGNHTYINGIVQPPSTQAFQEAV